MAKLSIAPGSTSQTVYVLAYDSGSTSGAGKTSIAYSSVTGYYVRTRGTPTSITMATLASATAAFSSGGWYEVDSTNMPGVYRFDIPDAVLASSSRSASVLLRATGMVPIALEIDLTNDANAVSQSGTALTARDIGASVLLSSGTGTGQVSLSSGKIAATLASTDVTGNVAADLQTIKTQTVTCSGGVTIPAATLASTTNITAGTITTTTNLTNAPTSGDFTATMKTSIGTAVAASAVASVTAGVTVTTNNDKTGYSLTATTGLGNQTANITGNLSGSVGSVTGNVGGVAGNVTGSVNSVVTGVNVTAIAASTITAASIAASALNGKGDWYTGTPPTSAVIAAAVWDLATSGHTTSGTFGSAMNAAGSAGDPWSTSVPGAYGAGTAGYILGTNLNATVSSRLATSGYTAPLDAAATRTAVGLASANLDTQLAAIKSDTGSTLTYVGTSGVVVASGSKTGYSLAAAGLDSIVIESGLNARQALSLNAAALAGVLSGAATTTVTVKGAGVATTRITATVDADGNRSALTLNPPA